MLCRLGFAFVSIVLLLTLGVRSVDAHANLSRSDPPANASLAQSPDESRLWFTEPLEPEFSRFALRDSDGNVVNTPRSQIYSTDPTQLFMTPGALPDGLFTVDWRVVSTDGHSTEGSFAFGVRVSVTPSTALPIIDETVPVESAIIRWFNILSMSLAVGSISFYLFVWIPAVPDGNPKLERRIMSLMWAGWGLVGVSGIFALLLQASIAAGEPVVNVIGRPTVSELVSGTRYGQIWLARQVFWLGIGAVLWYARGERSLYCIALVLGGQLLLTNSLYSHASSGQQNVTAAIAGDWLHLAATALWVGGLVQFINILGFTRSHFNADTTAISSLVAYFSNFARVAVAALLISGFYSAWLQVGSVEALLETVYGRALLVKLTLVIPLMTVSAINLLLTQRGLRRGQSVWIPRLRGLVGVEIVLTVGIVASVGVMTAIAPARAVMAVRNAEVPEMMNGSYFEMQTVDNLMAHFEIVPGYVGENTFIITLSDLEGNPVSNATLIRLRFENREQNLGQSELRPELQADGIYAATGGNLSVSGQWQIRMVVQRPEQFDTLLDFEPQISLPPPPPAPIIDTGIPPMALLLASLFGGLVLIATGGFFATRVHPRWLSGAGVTTAVMLLVGAIFLLTAGVSAVTMNGRSGILNAYNAWGLPAPMGMTGGVYVTIENGTDQTQQLIGATTDAAASVEIHQTQITNDIASMKPFDSIDIAAGETLKIAPRGYHLMLVNLKRDLSWADSFPITLNFTSGEQISVDVTIQAEPG